MRPPSLRILALFLATIQVVAGAVQTGMVLCQGENGHLALEVIHAEEECGHGCDPITDTSRNCDDEHSCIDTIARDDAQRQLDDADAKLPAPQVVGWLTYADRQATAHPRVGFAGRSHVQRALPGTVADALRTFILQV